MILNHLEFAGSPFLEGASEHLAREPLSELLLICSKLSLDAWKVIDAAATKPFSFMKFTPGPGLSGYCIPMDPHYLSWKMRTLQYTARFIELAVRSTLICRVTGCRMR